MEIKNFSICILKQEGIHHKLEIISSTDNEVEFVNKLFDNLTQLKPITEPALGLRPMLPMNYRPDQIICFMRKNNDNTLNVYKVE